MTKETRENQLASIKNDIDVIKKICPAYADLLDKLLKEAENCPDNEFEEKIMQLKLHIQILRPLAESVHNAFKYLEYLERKWNPLTKGKTPDNDNDNGRK